MMDLLKEARERLPILRVKKEIIEAVMRNKTVIFVGETGCGKTTQLPQFLLEAGFAKQKCIGVTQPRKVAATTIAKRVAQEVGTELGCKVGFSVRFHNVTTSYTKIKFLTDGMLLREAIGNPLLLDYSVVILDEAHERTLCNDLLFGIVKSAQQQREKQKLPSLKIIVMSATLEKNHVTKYFDAPAYSVIGRDYSIAVRYLAKPQENYVQAAIIAVFQIHQNEGPGDILVFCTGQEEIDYIVSEVRETALLLPAGVGKIYACGLYGALPWDQQTEVFKPVPEGVRKVIFATNIAETSITISNIKYVIDTGLVKVRTYIPSCGIDILKIQKISKAQSEQRAGRAGREFDGYCYRLYTPEDYRNFKDQTEPEILRCCLSSAILQMVAIGIKRIQEFDFIDRPSAENINTAIKLLETLEAITVSKGELELTECGKKMVRFPLDPRFSKMIISSKRFSCTDEILSIISLLNVESVFYTNLSEREDFNNARKKFESLDGDHIMLLNVYKQYKKCKGNAEWCKENYINSKNVRLAMTIRKQLSSICTQLGMINISSSSHLNIKKCLATGLFMNAAILKERKTFKLIDSNQDAEIHPSSCLFKEKKMSCCIYTELVQTSKVYMRNVSYIPEEMLSSVLPKSYKDKSYRLAKMKPQISVLSN